MVRCVAGRVIAETLSEIAVSRRPRCHQLGDAVAFHVINRDHNRETVFHDDDDRRAFLELIGRYRTRSCLALYHYCLMTNHFHLLLLRVADARSLSPLMAGLLRAYVHHCHRRQQLWREFLMHEDEREAVVRQSDWAIGDVAFVKRMRQVLGRPAARRRGRPARTRAGVTGGTIYDTNLFPCVTRVERHHFSPASTCGWSPPRAKRPNPTVVAVLVAP